MKTKHLYFSKKHFNRLHIILSVLALLSGGIIYILFRKTEPVFIHWIQAIAPESWFSTDRHISLHLPEWIVFSLPNGLWAFAYALLITGIWSGNKSRLKYLWISSIPVLVFGFELLQYFGLIRGSFSVLDLAFGAGGIITGCIVGRLGYRSKFHKKLMLSKK